MIDLLLVNPFLALQNRDRQRILKPYFPIGLLSIAAYIRKRSTYHVGVFDAALETDGESFSAACRRLRPRVVGVYATSFARERALAIMGQARDAGAFVVAGGPDPAEDEEAYFSGGAQALVRGEGEQTCLEILDRLEGIEGEFRLRDPESILGLIHLREGCAVRNPPRPFFTDVDALPDPDWEALDVNRHFALWKRLFGYTSLSVLTSRGCPLWCTWCSKTVFGQSYRKRSVARVAAEMRRLKERYAPDRLLIADDVFTMNRTWVARLAEEVRRLGAVMPFECIGRPEQLDERTVDALKAMGCAKVYLGAESGSQKVLDAMMKGFTVEQVERAAALLRSRGIPIGAFVMLGYPGEERKDVLMTGQLIRKINPEVLGVAMAHPLKGTTFQVDTLAAGPSFRTGYRRLFYWFAQRYIEKGLRPVSRPLLLRLLDSVKRAVYLVGMSVSACSTKGWLFEVPRRMANGRRIQREAYAKRPVAA